jgi:hypothetical protein
MFAGSACSVLFNETAKGKRLAKEPGTWLRALWTGLFVASLCLFVSACGNDDNKPPETTATTAEQINAAPPAPWAPPQNTLAQAAQATLPAQTIQTPPPAPAQVGAAASDSLAPPVIHSVD